MEEIIVDIVEVNACRVCGALDGILNILTDPLEGEILLHEALEFVTCLKVDTDDGMSQSLCVPCSERLLDAYRFKNLALDACTAFYKLSSNTNSIQVVTDESESVDYSNEGTEDNSGGVVLAEGAKEFTIDMSTDAVSFLIEHQMKNNKKKQFALEATNRQLELESIKPNSRTKSKKQCEICGKKFRDKSNLIDHMRLHANVRKFTCSYCDKSFVQVANYRTHLRIHTKERPFECNICQKSYSQSSTLKIHMRSHTQERNYICSVCDKGFTNSSDLKKHKNVHDPSQHFTCEFCHKLFSQKVNLKLHQKRVHLKG